MQRARLSAAAVGAELVATNLPVRQRSENDCGPAALCNFLNLRGTPCSRADLERFEHRGPGGVSMLELREAASRYGVQLEGWRFDPGRVQDVPTPFLAFLRSRHFVVVTSVGRVGAVEVIDPALGRLRYPGERFVRLWTGLCLIPAGSVRSHFWQNDLGRQVESPVTPDRIAARTRKPSERR
ncbi:MAG: cysteine peptidase family C39 domain-containing protein [Thermoanaerobaculia bacterium]